MRRLSSPPKRPEVRAGGPSCPPSDPADRAWVVHAGPSQGERGGVSHARHPRHMRAWPHRTPARRSPRAWRWRRVGCDAKNAAPARCRVRAPRDSHRDRHSLSSVAVHRGRGVVWPRGFRPLPRPHPRDCACRERRWRTAGPCGRSPVATSTLACSTDTGETRSRRSCGTTCTRHATAA